MPPSGVAQSAQIDDLRVTVWPASWHADSAAFTLNTAATDRREQRELAECALFADA